jgi:hypothetical protein
MSKTDFLPNKKPNVLQEVANVVKKEDAITKEELVKREDLVEKDPENNIYFKTI